MNELLYKLSFLNEVRENSRLQWLLVLVLFIVVLSLSDVMLGTIDAQASDVKSQARLLSKLNNAIENPIDENASKEISKALAERKETIPVSVSRSIAEAGALSSAEQKISVLLNNGRVDIVGTKTLTFANEAFWEVRIKIEGRMPPLKFIELLELFDGAEPHRRLVSMQYRPKAANVVTIVYDVMLKQVES